MKRAIFVFTLVIAAIVANRGFLRDLRQRLHGKLHGYLYAAGCGRSGDGRRGDMLIRERRASDSDHESWSELPHCNAGHGDNRRNLQRLHGREPDAGDFTS